MKRLIAMALSLTLLGAYAAAPVHAAEKQTETISYTYDAGRWTTQHREMEKLGRGLIAINTGSGVYLSWRLLDSEDARFGSAESNVSFNVYRGNTKIAEVKNSTNYTDTQAGSSYQVAPVVNGVEGDKCTAVSVQNGKYFDIPLQKPADATLANGSTAEYTANDASCGDIDGDGEYEIIVKWDANGQDNSKGGYTGNVLLDAYKLDGTHLWRVDLGKNIRAGAHYTQFLVYDFDGDGYAEMTCQTSLGSKDNSGSYVTKASHIDAINSITDSENENTDYRNDGGWTLQDGNREEFLTIFDHNGNAVDTIYYPNQIVNAAIWGDNYGNRCDRFTATVAYMDGEKPYAVYMRGYYFGQSGYGQRQAACAVSYDGSTLSCTHSFDTFDVNSYNGKSSSLSYSDGTYKGVDGYKREYAQYVGQGNHNCTVADVDGDGKDEVMTGALCYEFSSDNKSLVPKWCTFKEHGDALHIGDYDPTHDGFEFFTIHEDGFSDVSKPVYNKFHPEVTLDYGMSVIDAGSGDILFHESNHNDTGRGIMANIGAGGYYQIYSTAEHKDSPTGATKYTAGPYKALGNNNFEALNTTLSVNFRVFWDGDLYDELLDGVNITSWNQSRNRLDNIFSGDGVFAVNGTKANPSLQADLFGDWREEVVYPTTDSTALRVYSTTTPTDYKIKTLMHDPVYRMGVSAEQTAYNQPPHVGLYLAEDVFEAKPVSIAVTALPTKTKYVIGEGLDSTGLVVTATRDDGTSSPITTYTLSELDSSTPGEKTITVTSGNLTATFKVTVLSVSGISVTPPGKTTYSVGQSLSTNGMTVTATYSDGSTGAVPVSDCQISGFDSSELGECTVTVSYFGKEDTFKVNIIEGGRITLVNGTYQTSSTTSVDDTVEIGTYTGSFTLEHTVVINSMPADGSSATRNNDGFFMKFNPTNGVGGGWYITNNNGKANIVWKSTSTNTIAKSLNLGEPYKFTYIFNNVGDGSGAYVDVTITDASGRVVSSGTTTGLGLRNMTNDLQKTSPLGAIQIYNQATQNSTASVTIDNARIYDTGSFLFVGGSIIAYSLNGIGNARMFAAKYSGGRLTSIAEIPLTQLSEENVAQVDFDPDKVFMWTYDMHPIAVWTKETETAAEEEPTYTLTVTVTDAYGTPVQGAEVTAQSRSSSGSEAVSLAATGIRATTNSSGVAVITGLTSAPYLVQATYGEYTSDSKVVRVNGNTETEINFTDLTV